MAYYEYRMPKGDMAEGATPVKVYVDNEGTAHFPGDEGYVYEGNPSAEHNFDAQVNDVTGGGGVAEGEAENRQANAGIPAEQNMGGGGAPSQEVVSGEVGQPQDAQSMEPHPQQNEAVQDRSLEGPQGSEQLQQDPNRPQVQQPPVAGPGPSQGQ